MASKKDKAPLQPLNETEASEPNVKKSAKNKPAPAASEAPAPSAPEKAKAAASKVSAKKAAGTGTAKKETPDTTAAAAPATPAEPIKEEPKAAAKKAKAAKETPVKKAPGNNEKTAPEKADKPAAPPAAAQLSPVADVAPEKTVATKKAGTKKAAAAPPSGVSDAAIHPTPELKVAESAKPKRVKPKAAGKTKTPQIAVPFEPVEAEEQAAPSADKEVITLVMEAAPAAEEGSLTDNKADAPAEEAMPANEQAAAAVAALANVSEEAAEAPAEPVQVADEKNRAVAQKLAATGESIKSKAASLTFYVRFHSTPGQELFITAQHPLFGNGEPAAAVPMQYLNHETWTATVTVDDSFGDTPVSYNYLLKEPDGSFVYEAGSDKIIDLNQYTAASLSFVDAWNTTGFFENAFYTEPFTEVLLKNNHTSVEYTPPQKTTHTFKVKAPLLLQGQVPFIAGGADALGNWNADSNLLMHKAADEDAWSIEVDLTDATFPFEYKYGVFDVNENKTLQYENGENRSLYDTISPDKQTIVNDGFIRMANDTWKGTGVAIPVFSLKTANSFGAGEFADIKTLADWAKSVGIKLIQILPINDTTATKTWEDSYPYAAISAFALHAMYLNLDTMVSEANKSVLQQYEEERGRLNNLPAVDYERVNDIKWKVIHEVYPLQKDEVFGSADYQQFFEDNKHWLVPYAAFCYLRDKNGTADYSRWPEKTYSEALAEALQQNEEAQYATGMYYFVQYHLHLQLKDATDYAHSQGIIVKGDIAIGVSRHGADTWQEPELFNMNLQAGAPPDDFAVKGQNWGFPTYNWQKMQEDGFEWWRRRFEQMSRYFDAFRIDHILGFFRIWSIPTNAIQGILGRFVPAIPVHVSEFHQRNIYFDYTRYVKPFINDQVLNDLFGDQQWWVKDHLLNWNEDGTYTLKDEVSTQARVQTYFAIREDNAHNQWLKNTLFDLIANVILFEQKDSNGQSFHFRYGIEDTLSYQLLDAHTQWQLKQLYVNYFYERQDQFWYHEAMNKLPALKRATNMLICGEDLGMVPATVPRVMQELGLLSLEVQRMPKDSRHQFTHIAGAPYLSVVTPSTHDMSTIRGWWEEDRAVTQAFYNNELGQQGEAPAHCEAYINKMVIDQHLYSPAMWSIFQLQDLLGSDEQLRRANPQEERINQPAIPRYYWQYRMHLSLEDLLNAGDFNNSLRESIANSGR